MDVLADPQNTANGYIVDMDLPVIGPSKVVGNLIGLSATPGSVKGPPPALGEATAEVMGRLGFGKAEIESVIAQANAQREALLAAAASRRREVRAVALLLFAQLHQHAVG